ncbi:MAG: NAD-dependent epimerase/dehydratase family protein [Candidatus Glassbacteria bacterium]
MLVLVTGGAGFIGSHTTKALLEAGYDVRILDNLDPKIHPNGKPKDLPEDAHFIEADVRDPDAWVKALDGVSHVLHFAAYQDYLTDFSTFYHVNAVGTALMYEVIIGKKLPVERVIVASSQAVYGEGRYRCPKHGELFPPPRPREKLIRGEWDHACPRCERILTPLQTTELVTNPANSYAISKYTQETLAINLGRQYGIPTTALRYSIVQGPRQSFYNAYSGVCRVFCLSAYFGEKAIVFEDGNQLRDYVNIQDVVKANLLVLNDNGCDYEIYNVGGGGAYTVLEFLSIVEEVSGRKVKVEIGNHFRSGDSRHIVSDISKIRGLGFAPLHSPAKSVEDYLDWLEECGGESGIISEAYERMKSSKVVCSVT